MTDASVTWVDAGALSTVTAANGSSGRRLSRVAALATLASLRESDCAPALRSATPPAPNEET